MNTSLFVKCYCLLVLLLQVPASIHTQEATSEHAPNISGANVMTLEQIIRHGLAHNRAIRTASLQEENASYKRAELFARLLPQINASAGVDYYTDLPVSFLPRSAFSALFPSSSMTGTQQLSLSSGDAAMFLRINLGLQWNASSRTQALVRKPRRYSTITHL